MVAEEQAMNSSLDFLNERKELIISEPIENWEEKVVHIKSLSTMAGGPAAAAPASSATPTFTFWAFLNRASWPSASSLSWRSFADAEADL